MGDEDLDQLSPDVLKAGLLRAVASENLDDIPDDLPERARFVVAGVRVVATRADLHKLCVFVYSEASRVDTEHLDFTRIAHMQDGHGEIDGCIVATNQDANNGMRRAGGLQAPDQVMKELEGLGFGGRCTMIWDPAVRVATIYPAGVSNFDNNSRHRITSTEADLTETEVSAALDQTYNENLKNPSAHTINIWKEGQLVERAEDEIERHIKGQLTMYFVGKARRVKILSQVNTDAGRTDLIFLQRVTELGPNMVGVVELKVLRGPEAKNKKDTEEGLSQGYFYRDDLGLPFAILAMFDVAKPPSDSLDNLLDGQCREHLDRVHVKRYPIYNTPKAWRDARVH